ncbi:MAG: sugar phosphate isomerase/epimerase [Planctomycetes bacterium]|nr:sugar phosphate isomerase/epimerase [Planctomycetota bacterium]
MNPTHRRLGFSFLYFTPHVTDAHHRWFERLRAHGYDGAELPVVAATEAELVATRRALDTNDLAATAVGFATTDADPLAADAAGRQRAIDHLRALCDKARTLGADVLAGPIHSAYGRFSELPPTAAEHARCVEVLRAAGDHAAKVGVTLAVEPLNRFECYFLNTAADCAELVRAIDHPNVRGALDTHHAHIEERSLAAAIASSRGTLGHVQLSENHRGTPGTGQVDFTSVRTGLDAIGYDGWLVVEAFSRHDPHFGSALRIWRTLDQGAEDVLAAGATLARTHFGATIPPARPDAR